LRAAKAVDRGNTEAIFHRDTAVGQGWRLHRFAVADLIGSDLLGFKPCPSDQTPTGGGFILDEKDWSKWLGEEPATEQELFALLRPCPDERLKIWPIDNKVGDVRNTGRELMLPLEKRCLRFIAKRRSNHCCNESICWECHPLPGRWRNDRRDLTWNSGGTTRPQPPRLKARLASHGIDAASVNIEVFVQARDLFVMFDSLMHSAQSRRIVLLREIAARRAVSRQARGTRISVSAL
jgi:hypothetical protein